MRIVPILSLMLAASLPAIADAQGRVGRAAPRSATRMGGDHQAHSAHTDGLSADERALVNASSAGGGALAGRGVSVTHPITFPSGGSGYHRRGGHRHHH